MPQLKCRTCFEVAGHLYPLTDPYEAADRTLSDLLLDITKIDTKDKNAKRLPQHICGTCSRKLKTAYSFVQQARRVNDHLLKLWREETAVAASGPSKDCLLEAPIDIPAASSSADFQIKMEAADIGEESVYDAFSVLQMPVAVECDVGARSDEASGSGSSKNKTKVGVPLKNEELEASSSSAAQSSLDPIIVASTHWHNESDDDDNDDMDDMMDQNNDTESPYVEDRKCLLLTAEASTKKRKIFTIEEKSIIVSRLLSGSSNKKLAKEFGVSHSTISTIWRNRELIQKSSECESPRRKRIRPPQNSDIEQELLRWLHERQQGQYLPISGRMLQEQANEIAKQLGKAFNTISDSWIYRFRMRNNIVLSDRSRAARIV